MENQSTWDEEEVWIQNGPNEEEEDAEDASEDEAPSRKRPRISKLSPQNIRAVTLLAAYEMRFGHAPPRDIWEFDLPSYLSGTVSRKAYIDEQSVGFTVGFTTSDLFGTDQKMTIHSECDSVVKHALEGSRTREAPRTLRRPAGLHSSKFKREWIYEIRKFGPRIV